MAETDLRAVLEALDSQVPGRPTPRSLIHDQADRDAVDSQLLRYRNGRGDDWADIIDMLASVVLGLTLGRI